MGILLGMLLSLVLLLFRIMKPRIVFPPHPEYLLPEEAVAAGLVDDGRIMRMRFEGSLVFVNVSLFEEQLQRLLASSDRLRVLINDVDASGEEMLRENFKRLQEAGIHVLFTRIKPHIMATFKRSRLCDVIDAGCFNPEPSGAFAMAWDLISAEDVEPAEEEVEEAG